MAEKAFKVPSLALVGSENQLAVNTATADLWWGTNALATQLYVDTAVNNVSVNVEALAGTGLVETNGVLSVNTNSVAEGITGSSCRCAWRS